MVDLYWAQVSPKKVDFFRAFASLLFHLAFPSVVRWLLTGIVNDILGAQSKVHCAAVSDFPRSRHLCLYLLELGHVV